MYLCKVAVQRKLCRRFALSGCFLLSVLHTESAIEGNAILIRNIDDSNSLVVNLVLFAVVDECFYKKSSKNFIPQRLGIKNGKKANPLAKILP